MFSAVFTESLLPLSLTWAFGVLSSASIAPVKVRQSQSHRDFLDLSQALSRALSRACRNSGFLHLFSRSPSLPALIVAITLSTSARAGALGLAGAPLRPADLHLWKVVIGLSITTLYMSTYWRSGGWSPAAALVLPSSTLLVRALSFCPRAEAVAGRVGCLRHHRSLSLSPKPCLRGSACSANCSRLRTLASVHCTLFLRPVAPPALPSIILARSEAVLVGAGRVVAVFISHHLAFGWSWLVLTSLNRFHPVPAGVTVIWYPPKICHPGYQNTSDIGPGGFKFQIKGNNA